jgi:MoaA/NifB/PqqE/SkfB family radical SAM enzyme
MLRYLPWSENILQEALESYVKGNIPTLCLDLTAKCSLGSCLYCDSEVGAPNSNELKLAEIEKLILDLKKHGLMWVFICGLGEPREDPSFLEVLRLLKENQVRTSFFTNGLFFEEDDIGLLAKCDANILVKLDSFDAEVFDKLLGRRGAAKRIYDFVGKLLIAGFPKVNEREETNLAFSIVPTRLNIATIPEVVEFCKEHNIFPCIGEMEYANKAIRNWDILSVSNEELRRLLQEVSVVLGYEYERGLCQGIIPSLHVNNVGKCVVESETGLSCGWFLQKDVTYKVVGDIRKMDIKSIINNATEYRLRRLPRVEDLLRIDATISFGGGANPNKWYNDYVTVMKRLERNWHEKP